MDVPGYEDGDPGEVRLLPERLEVPLRWGRPRRVFVNSMSDVFHPRVPYEFIDDIFDVMREASEQRGACFPSPHQAAGPDSRMVGAPSGPLQRCV